MGPERAGTRQDLGQVGMDSFCPFASPQRPVLWLGKLVGVVYLTELLTLPSSPSSPEGWLDLSVPGAIIVKGLLQIAIPRP